MQHKNFELLEVKTDGDAGTFTALASVFNNVDRVGDKMLPGSFAKTLGKWRESGKPIPVILSHNWDDPHKYVGEADPRAVFEDKRGLVVQGRMYTNEDLGRKVYELMKKRILTGWSFGYKVPQGGQTKNNGVNEISEVELFEVGPTLVGANPDAQLQEIKAVLAPEVEETTEDLDEKAVWSAAFINDLPDSSFLYIEPGGSKDGEGKTTPRSLRHFPVKDSSGNVDMPHLRNALSRIPQSNLPQSVKDRCTAAARRMMGSQTSSDEPEQKDYEEDLRALREEAAKANERMERMLTELIELRQAQEELKKTSEVRRNEEPERAKSPPDPLKEESRKAVLAVRRDGVPANVERREPEPEPEIDLRELKAESRRAALSVLKGGLDGK